MHSSRMRTDRKSGHLVQGDVWGRHPQANTPGQTPTQTDTP